MTKRDVIRAWKDEEYRESLGENELAGLPESPAGLTELPDTDLEAVAGGTTVPCGYGVYRGYRAWTRYVTPGSSRRTAGRCCGGRCTSSVSCA